MTPLLLDIKRNSLDDGPGVRSVVFFKGCPLSCVWCQNPEAIARGPQLQRDVEACAGCGACQRACPHGVARPADTVEARADCQRCGVCVEACPAAARRIAGEAKAIEQIVAELLEDEPFYRRSGGGVTLSGGEATLFCADAGAIAQALCGAGVHVLLETCGLFSWRSFSERLLPYLTTVYFDLKLADPLAHGEYCGADNGSIVQNLGRLATSGVELLPRVPLVPGITDSADNLEALAAIITDAGLSRVALLPYNPLWLAKRRGLGMELPYAHEAWMESAAVEACERTMEQAGLELVR